MAHQQIEAPLRWSQQPRQVGQGERGGFVRVGADEAVVHGVAGAVAPGGGGVAHDQADGGGRAVRGEELRPGGGAPAERGRGVPDVGGGLADGGKAGFGGADVRSVH